MYEDPSRPLILERFEQGRFLIYLVAITWVISLVNLGILGSTLNQFGIRPRTLSGLLGVFFAPFLHSTWTHLEGNTILFLVFGALVLFRDPTDFGAVVLTVTILSGVGTWLVGRPPNHIGGSGVVFGLFGFLLTIGFVDRTVLSVLVVAITALFFANRLWLLFPMSLRMPWEAHLFGFLGGIYAAQNLPQIKVWFEQIALVARQIGAWIR
jgi:membrane associated rhomboid family serine protease